MLIRLLLGRAEEQTKQSQPFSADSVNRLHDVAEMFLALAAEIHHVGIPKDFMRYWPVLELVLDRPLAYRAQMQKLNKLRVNLKHYGLEPTPDQISEALVTVRGLITDECHALFGLELDEVSISDVVTIEDVRNLLVQADKHCRAGTASKPSATSLKHLTS